MKHVEIKNLKLNLDVLIQAVADNKITNSYLNYGLIRNNGILTKAVEVIESSLPTEVKDLEIQMYQAGLKAYEAMPTKTKNEIDKLVLADKNNRIFNMGFALASNEDKEKRNKLTNDYNTFLELDNDTELYYLDFSKLSDIDLEIKYWGILNYFIK